MGGQGTVYVATGPSGERVAVKWIRSDLTGDALTTERFLREVAAAKRVATFCTAQILDTGVEHDRPYIVSEYIDGPSLQQSVMTTGPIRGNALYRLAIGTATALAAIHRAGIVHRDLKPPNVVMGPDGARVIDFGISRALDATSSLTSAPIGTPAYMAPEQFLDRQIGPAADMFSWASTMVFAATGRSPFGSDSLPVVINRILNGRPEIRHIEGRLEALVTSCLDKDPARRPTAQQVIDALLEQSAAEPEPASQETSRPSRAAAPPPQAVTAPPSQDVAFPGIAEASPDGRSGGPAGGMRTRAGRPPAKVVAATSVAIAAIGASVFLLNSGGRDDAETGATRVRTSLAASSPAGTADGTPPATAAGPAPRVIATTGLTSTKLPGTSATLYDHPGDALAITAYEVRDSKGVKGVYARASRDEKFKKWSGYSSIEVSPDGRYAAGIPRSFYKGHDSVDIITLATGRISKVRTVPSPQEERWAQWSRAGDRILLTSTREKGSKTLSTGFIVVDVAKKKASVFKVDDPTISNSTFAWDGDEQGVVALFKTGKTKGLRFYDSAGKVLRDITDVFTTWDDARNLFSPSGRSFVANCAGAEGTYCVRAATTGHELRRFTSDCAYLYAWYDESHILCEATGDGDQDAVVIVNLDGDAVRTVLRAGDKTMDKLYVSLNFRASS